MVGWLVGACLFIYGCMGVARCALPPPPTSTTAHTTTQVACSMVEIYNETIKDLLARPPPLPPVSYTSTDNNANAQQRKAALAARKRWAPPQLEIRQAPAERGGGVYLPGG